MPDSITHEELRAAVTYEVRQQLTPYLLQVGQDREDLRLIKWTLYGNTEAGEKGLVKSMKEIQTSLDVLVKAGDQRKWIQNGIVIGLGLNLLASTGILEAIVHAMRSLP